MSKRLAELVKRAEQWPEAAQQELVNLAEEIDQELSAGAYDGQPPDIGTYRLTDGDKAAIEEGLAAAKQGRFATEEEVKAVFAKYRRA